MSKSTATKAHIIKQSALLFNQQGYAGASLSDVMAATGLKKGGIYNHFESKDELAIAAFDFAVQQAIRLHARAVRGQRGAIAQLKAIVDSFVTSFDEISAMGGCPLLNTAIESDDTHPALRERTQRAMNNWRQLIRRLVQKGQAAGSVQAAVDPDEVATILITTLEGALMLAKLYGDDCYLHQIHDHLDRFIESLQTPV